jgi:DNA-binding CsgD family transcriptional regulator
MTVALRERDLRSALGLLHEVADAAGDGGEAFARAGVAALARLVASEITTLSVCDLRTGHRRVIGTPPNAIGAADRAAFDRHFRSHPLVRYHADERGTLTHRISDSVPFARFREGALYSEYYRHIGIDHAVAIPLRVDDGLLVSFVLNRRGRDFGERDWALLECLRPNLAQLYRLARRIERARADGAAPCRLHIDAACWPGTPPAIRIDTPLTAREREVLRWVAAGKTDRDIGAILGISARTVGKHLEHGYAKLGVETRTAAVMRALGGAPH